MNAYEFTRFEADFTNTLKAKSYNITDMAKKIYATSGGRDFRKDSHYKECEDMYVELTMSCDKKEAIGWMQYWMVNAIAYGIQTKNLDWKCKFLAAYDLYNSLA